MHEQCMQLNVWLLIEIQIENTLGLMNEKSNILKSHRVGGITFIILSTKRPEIRLRNVLSTKRPTPIKSSLHSISTCNIPLIQNDPGRSTSFLTVRASPGFEPGSPDWETNALPTRPNRLPYHHNFSRVDIECNPSCSRVSFDITQRFLHL